MGHHFDHNAPKLDVPYDPPPHGVGVTPDPSSSAPPVKPTEPANPVDPVETSGPEPPSEPNQPKDNKKKWWEWIADTYETAKKKLSQLFGHESS